MAKGRPSAGPFRPRDGFVLTVSENMSYTEMDHLTAFVPTMPLSHVRVFAFEVFAEGTLTQYSPPGPLQSKWSKWSMWATPCSTWA